MKYKPLNTYKSLQIKSIYMYIVNTKFWMNKSYTVRKEMKGSGEIEILNQLVHDTTRISLWFSDFRIVSWTNSYFFSVSPLHLIYF